MTPQRHEPICLPIRSTCSQRSIVVGFDLFVLVLSDWDLLLEHIRLWLVEPVMMVAPRVV
jgi:hypothetical protein